MMKRNRISNISKVLNALWTNNKISRVDISKITDLDKSTITHIVNEFIEEGLIETLAEGEASPLGGRKPTFLTINKNYGIIVGAEIQTDFCRLCAVDLSGNAIKTEKHNLEQKLSIASILENYINPFILNLESQNKKVLGTGIGLPGITDPFNSILQKSENFNIDNPLKLTSRNVDNDKPLIYENDAKCCAWGELAIWREKNIREFLTVLIEINVDEKSENTSIGVGFAIVIDGKIHHGRDFSTGEFKSLRCTNNCETQFSLSKNEFSQIFKDNKIMNKFLNELTEHIAFLVNMLNLTHVFFGGDSEIFKGKLEKHVNQKINANWAYDNAINIDTLFLTHGQYSVAYGAAGFVLNCIFSSDAISSNEGKTLPSGIDFLF